MSLPADAQVVSGRVLDDGTGHAMGGAELLLADQDDRTAARAVSADDGTFTLRPEEHACYRLDARRLGYATTTSWPLDRIDCDNLAWSSGWPARRFRWGSDGRGTPAVAGAVLREA